MKDNGKEIKEEEIDGFCTQNVINIYTGTRI